MTVLCISSLSYGSARFRPATERSRVAAIYHSTSQVQGWVTVRPRPVFDRIRCGVVSAALLLLLSISERNDPAVVHWCPRLPDLVDGQRPHGRCAASQEKHRRLLVELSISPPAIAAAPGPDSIAMQAVTRPCACTCVFLIPQPPADFEPRGFAMGCFPHRRNQCRPKLIDEKVDLSQEATPSPTFQHSG